MDGGADAGLDGGLSDSGRPDGGLPDGGLPDSGPPEDAGRWPVQIPLEGCGVDYTATVVVGGTQSFTFVLDTGSTTTAVAGSTCQSCIDGGVTPLYAPGTSATDKHKTALSAYADTSSWKGEIYQDTVTIGATPPVAVDFADIETQVNFFAYLDYYCRASISGILGFGPSPLLVSGTTSYLDQVVDAGMPDVFSFRLCPSGGTLWLGGFDAQFVPQYTPMSTNELYTVVLSSIDVGGQSLGLPASDFGGAFVDTGGQAFWLPPTAFDAVVNALGNDANFTSLLGDAKTFFSPSTYCVYLSQSAAELDAMLPPLTLTFGSGITLQSPATSSYLYELPGCGYTPAMYTRGSVPGSRLPNIELGAPILKNKVVVIDRAQQRIGFVDAPCE
jgi:hypothetical protein